MSTETKSIRLCPVHGCPLPGVYTTSTTGSTEWFCFVHDGLQATDWQAATQRIHERKALLRLLFKLQNSPAGEPIPDETREGLKAAGYPSLAASKADTCRKLGYELRALLSRECKGEPNHLPSEIRAMRETWANAAGLVGTGQAFDDEPEAVA